MTDIETWSSDSFESKYTGLMIGMSEEEKRKAAVNVLHLCQCSKCPSNTETGDINAIYCTFGKSNNISRNRGCLCKDCPITRTMSMRWEYYCMKGSAVEMSDL